MPPPPFTTEPGTHPCGRSSRRRLLGAAALGASLTGCQVYREPGTAPADGSPEPVTVLARMPDVPVGGGLIVASSSVVVTRPSAERVLAFSAVCTHAGCAVSEVADGTINCPCHGSRFAVADGSVVSGPARRPLPSLPVTVANETIRLA
ncbi:Rieske (2Fe-2S) protein [Mangrovihabitans endophyticus]|uniref:Cytochrome bc1 complex Rieske iron-sulfur subunit n=1 Tax=Mangrovihabitans endophyticus TaxID=1751298 RepID=A0A8J3FMP0_9ACTN|nr:Rieske (2Fe-2S) protein [Mangrovihabitans endophyticus]GGK77498.1 iron-sulfur protein [Mangrovihabitans endophyticus]